MANANYKDLFRDGTLNLLKLSDVTLHTEDGQSFPVHRYELAKKQKYFYALFCGVGSEKKDILISGMKGDVLSNILSYIYSGQVHVTEENFSELVIAADFLLLDSLLSHMKSLLPNILSVSNAIAVYAATLKINTVDILEECFRFIETHFEEIARNKIDEFYQLSPDILKRLLYGRNLRVLSENIVWLSIVGWVEADVSNRLRHVPELLACIKIGDVDEDLASQVLGNDIVAKNEFFEKVDFDNTADWSSVLKLHLFYWSNAAKLHLLQPSNNEQNFHRTPTHLHFICRYRGNCPELFVTYDEKTDLWRRVTEIYRESAHILPLYDYIYFFEVSGENNYRYSTIYKQFLELPSLRTQRHKYTAVKSQGCIYVLGEITEDIDFKKYSVVDVFKPEENIWHECARMPAIASRSAVAICEFIYVVGVRSFTNFEMIAIAYNTNTKLWTTIPKPCIDRSSSTGLVAYRKELYLIGGKDKHATVRREVEVFNPVSNTWNFTTNLPYDYHNPKAVVINDKLIVYSVGYSKGIAPVQWNPDKKIWESIEESSPLFDLHNYKFCSADESEGMNFILKENKDPSTVFEKSPFGYI